MKNFLATAAVVFNLGCALSTGSDPKDEPIPEDAFADSAFEMVTDAAWEQQLVDILTKAEDSDTKWSVDVRALGPRGEKKIVFRKDSTQIVRSASLMKLFSAWAYLHAFPDLEKSSPNWEKLQDAVMTSDNRSTQRLLDEAAGKLGGYEATRKLFRDHGINGIFVDRETDGYHNTVGEYDGSGLNYKSKVNSFSVVKQLWTVFVGEFRENFLNLLPVGGQSGTLKKRPKLHRDSCVATVLAKTGTLLDNPAAALGGFAKLPNHYILLFSIIGDSPSSVRAGEKAIDELLCRVVKKVAKY